MESATVLTPLAPAYVVFCFPSEPNILEGPEYEKNINTVSMYGEVHLDNLEKKHPSEKEKT